MPMKTLMKVGTKSCQTRYFQWRILQTFPFRNIKITASQILEVESTSLILCEQLFQVYNIYCNALNDPVYTHIHSKKLSHKTK
jgi:hypothetical protein